MNSALGGAPFEGAFASRVLSRNLEVLGPYHSILAAAGALRAAPGGLLQGRFGFADGVSGLVYNAQQAPTDACGVVVPLSSVNAANGGVIGGPAAFGGPVASWSWQTFDRTAGAWRLREGIVCTLMDAGNFWLRFPSGATYGQAVYASTVDGSAYSGLTVSAIKTAFKVCSDAQPGALAIVSSTARFNT